MPPAGPVAIWGMNGTSTIGGGLVSDPGPTWHIKGTGDFNNDGRTDIAFQNDNGKLVLDQTPPDLAPANAPSWAQDRAQLWNAAERAEPRANGRLATEIELALPHELTDAPRKTLLTDYLRPLIERHHVAADVAIHAPGQGSDHRNIHAHVLITHRELGPDGFGEVSNARTVTVRAKNTRASVSTHAHPGWCPAWPRLRRLNSSQAVSGEHLHARHHAPLPCPGAWTTGVARSRATSSG